MSGQGEQIPGPFFLQKIVQYIERTCLKHKDFLCLRQVRFYCFLRGEKAKNPVKSMPFERRTAIGIFEARQKFGH